MSQAVRRNQIRGKTYAAVLYVETVPVAVTTRLKLRRITK